MNKLFIFGFGSPLALGGWKISLMRVRLNRSASLGSCQLVGKSLLEIQHLTNRCLNRIFCWKIRLKTAFSLIQMIRVTKHDALPHFTSSEQKKISYPLKLETEWKGADACGTARAGETNVARTLSRWLNTRPTASSPLQRSRKAEAFLLTSFYFCHISCKFCSAVLTILLTNLTSRRSISQSI